MPAVHQQAPQNQPAGFHSTDPRWKPDSREGRLLEFCGELIIDLAHTHPAITHKDVASWLVRVVVNPTRKAPR